MPPPLQKMEERNREKTAAPRSWHLGGELRALLRLAIPVVLSELAWMLMSVVDTIMVGRLSPEAIGAVGLSSSLYYIPALFGAGLLLGLDTLVSQAYGRGDHADCRKWVMQGLYIALLFSVPVMIVVQWIPALLPPWGTNPAVASQTAEYLRLLNWGTPWLLTYACFRRYLQGMHIVKPVTFALVTANLVNLAGNWLLIYGKFGLPEMGVRGSALSTVLARVYMAAFLVAAAIWHENKAGGSVLSPVSTPEQETNPPHSGAAGWTGRYADDLRNRRFWRSHGHCSQIKCRKLSCSPGCTQYCKRYLYGSVGNIGRSRRLSRAQYR